MKKDTIAVMSRAVIEPINQMFNFPITRANIVRQAQLPFSTHPHKMSQKSTAAPRFTIRNVTNAISTNTERIIQFIAELNKRGKFHGIDHFVNKKYHPIERFLWLCLVIAAFYGCYYVGNNQMERFAASPTVISIERGTFIAL